MKVTQINTDDVIAFTFPGCEKPIGIEFDPNNNSLMFDPDEILVQTPVLAVIVAEVAEDIMSNSQELRDAWQQLWSANEEGDHYLGVDQVLSAWNLPGVLALEITTFGMACGPVSDTVFYLVNENDWKTASFING